MPPGAGNPYGRGKSPGSASSERPIEGAAKCPPPRPRLGKRRNGDGASVTGDWQLVAAGGGTK